MSYIPARLHALLGHELAVVTEDHLTSLLGLDEEEDLDFKSALYPDNDGGKRDLACDVAALANARGGLLVLGVEQDAHGRASGLVPLQLPVQHEEPLRIQTIVASRVFPAPMLQARVIDSGQSGHGYVVVAVPRSTSAPHAVKDGDRLRYVRRTGSGNRTLAESEVADAYRNRFTESRGRTERLHQIHPDGVERLDRSNYPWVAISVVPASAGSLELRAGTPEAFVDWAKNIETLMHEPLLGLWQATVHASTRMGRVTLTNGLYAANPGLSFSAELYMDGSGFAAGYVGWPRDDMHVDNYTGVDPPGDMVIIPDERLPLTAAELLLMLTAHAVDHTGCVGDAVVIVELLGRMEGTLVHPSYLCQTRGDFTHPTLGVRPVDQVKGPEHAISLSDTATPGPGLLVATRMLVSDLFAEFGVPEVPQLTSSGEVRLPLLSQRTGEAIQRWAPANGVGVVS